MDAHALRRVSVCMYIPHSRHRSPVCPLELACPPCPSWSPAPLLTCHNAPINPSKILQVTALAVEVSAIEIIDLKKLLCGPLILRYLYFTSQDE